MDRKSTPRRYSNIRYFRHAQASNPNHFPLSTQPSRLFLLIYGVWYDSGMSLKLEICMSEKRYIVRLSEEERSSLLDLISKGKGSANKLLRARILLKADVNQEGGSWTDVRISEALETNEAMVVRVRTTLVEEGLERALTRKQRTTAPRTPVFDGEKEAQLIALACSPAPEGHARWTLQLLADTLVERQILPKVSDTTIYRCLKKTNLNRILKNSG
jgi:Homeodomain-like domain